MEDKIIASGIYLLMSVFYAVTGITHLLAFFQRGGVPNLVIGLIFLAVTPYSLKRFRDAWEAGLSAPN
jgi:hypothetical protein